MKTNNEPHHSKVTDRIDPDRRRFLERVAMVVGAAQTGLLSVTAQGASRELTAISRASQWLNAPPPTPDTLVRKVVLVQFCTYTCINWLRTLPFIRAWEQRYRGSLMILGVHTPEFAFEHDIENVRRAIRQLKVDYPIAIDNDYSIWRAFGNNYWPALYFVDARGRIRDRHFGEGRYDQSERLLQRLLTEVGVADSKGAVVSVDPAGVEAQADWATLQSPESYLGYDRAETFASPGGVARDRRRLYAAPGRLGLNRWALAGEWTIGNQATAAGAPNGRLLHRFHARDLHLVMGPPRKDTVVRFRVTLDGSPPGAARGVDVDGGGYGMVVEQRLHQLIRQPKPIVDRTFEIEFLEPGVEVFAFTFG
jgi:hypothetical protein